MGPVLETGAYWKSLQESKMAKEKLIWNCLAPCLDIERGFRLEI